MTQKHQIDIFRIPYKNIWEIVQVWFNKYEILDIIFQTKPAMERVTLHVKDMNWIKTIIYQDWIDWIENDKNLIPVKWFEFKKVEVNEKIKEEFELSFNQNLILWDELRDILKIIPEIIYKQRQHFDEYYLQDQNINISIEKILDLSKIFSITINNVHNIKINN